MLNGSTAFTTLDRVAIRKSTGNSGAKTGCEGEIRMNYRPQCGRSFTISGGGNFVARATKFEQKRVWRICGAEAAEFRGMAKVRDDDYSQMAGDRLLA